MYTTEHSEVAGAGMVPRRRRPAWFVPLIVAVVVILCAVGALLRFGGDLLVNSNPLPRQAQVAVVLNGSAGGVRARTAEAVRLLKSGVVQHLMISIPPTTYWGESVPVVAHRYFEARFGPEVANQIVFCVSNADSTIEEAAVLRQCLENHGWHNVIVVTSNYHTRRAGDIWRATLAKADPPFTLSMHGVADGLFQPQGWWRNRRYAKTWLLETAKLVWESVFGRGPWKGTPLKPLPSSTAASPSPQSQRRATRAPRIASDGVSPPRPGDVLCLDRVGSCLARSGQKRQAC